MRLYDGIRVLAVTGTIAATAAPAAHATQAMQMSGGVPASAAAPAVAQQSDGSPDWVLIGAGAGAIVLIGGVAGSRRAIRRVPQSHGLN